MAGAFLTSAEVARLLGVSAGTVKRWADAGLLGCDRTAGMHRRFARAAVERFRRERAPEGGAAAPGLVDRLLEEPEPIALQADLLRERARRGAWWRVAEWISGELEEMGRRWERGTLPVVGEHLASDRLGRALARCGEMLPARPDAPRALLAAAEGDEHLLGLALVDGCLRELGWSPLWSGRATPAPEIVRQVEAGAVDAVVLSASVVSPAPALAAEAAAVGAACRAAGVHLLAGGHGPWPEPLPFGRLERTFSGLRAWADEVERVAPS